MYFDRLDILRKPLRRFLTMENDGVTYNAIGNYLVAGLGNKNFYVDAKALGASEVYIDRLMIEITDGGAPGFDADKYGGLAAALTNGVKVEVQSSSGTSVIHSLTHLIPVKTNIGWGSHCYDINHINLGSGNEALLVRWSFNKSTPIRLTSADGYRFSVFLQDDFTGLARQHFKVEGGYFTSQREIRGK